MISKCRYFSAGPHVGNRRDEKLSIIGSRSLRILIKNTNYWTRSETAVRDETGPKGENVEGPEARMPLEDMCAALSRRDAVQYLLRWNNMQPKRSSVW